jgi:RimJ/RimL family protein N-acetyltransferase
VLETERLILRRMSTGDAAFILELLNEPSFLRYIGDRGVRTITGACDYILGGPVASYERYGFGLYVVEPKERRVPMGICGLVKRASLPDADVGFAFLPRYWSKGYAFESASAAMEHGRTVLGLHRIVAVTVAANERSIRVLEKLGLKFEGLLRLSEDEPEIELFA